MAIIRPGMSTKSRDHLYGHSVRWSAEEAARARKEADRLACRAWTQRMLAFKGPAQPSPTIADALNAGMNYRARHYSQAGGQNVHS